MWLKDSRGQGVLGVVMVMTAVFLFVASAFIIVTRTGAIMSIAHRRGADAVSAAESAAEAALAQIVKNPFNISCTENCEIVYGADVSAVYSIDIANSEIISVGTSKNSKIKLSVTYIVNQQRQVSITGWEEQAL